MKKKIDDILQEYKNIPDFMGVDIVDVHSRSRYGDQSLHMACVSGNIEEVITFLDAGADINAIGEDGYTPLQYATEHNHVELVKLLLEKGADKTIKSSEGETALDMALLLNEVEIQKLLES